MPTTTKNMKEYWVSNDGGKTFHQELLKPGQKKKKVEMGQIVLKHPCHKCWHWYWRGETTGAYANSGSANNCHFPGKHIEDGVCLGFDPMPEPEEYDHTQDRYDAYNETWN